MHEHRRLTRFYSEISSLDSIVKTLSQEGVDTGRLTAADLYTRGLDCQNLGGFPLLEAVTAVAAEYGKPGSDQQVIDIGCGLGGPARYLADRYGCAVTGVDLLPLRIDTARMLTQMVGLGDRVTCRVADATNLPFGAVSFSQVWMLDAAIHVRGKAELFGEAARVLRPGGLLVLHDQTAPLPKAMAPVTRRAPYSPTTLSRLVRYVEDAGMRLLTWRDTTDLVRAHYERRQAFLMDRPENDPGRDRKRRERSLVSIAAYVAALADPAGRTGVLVARRKT